MFSPQKSTAGAFLVDPRLAPLRSVSIHSRQRVLRRYCRSVLLYRRVGDIQQDCPQFRTDRSHGTSVAFCARGLACKRPEQSKKSPTLLSYRTASSSGECTEIPLGQDRPPRLCPGEPSVRHFARDERSAERAKQERHGRLSGRVQLLPHL